MLRGLSAWLVCCGENLAGDLAGRLSAQLQLIEYFWETQISRRGDWQGAEADGKLALEVVHVSDDHEREDILGLLQTLIDHNASAAE